MRHRRERERAFVAARRSRLNHSSRARQRALARARARSFAIRVAARLARPPVARARRRPNLIRVERRARRQANRNGDPARVRGRVVDRHRQRAMEPAPARRHRRAER